MMSVRGKKIAYTKTWDLSGLPKYEPRQKASGKLRLVGQQLHHRRLPRRLLGDGIQEAPSGCPVRFRMKTTLAAVPSLIFG